MLILSAVSYLRISSKSFQLSNYAETWVRGGYGQSYINSIIVGFSSVALLLMVAGLCAYALAKLEILAKGFFTGFFVAGLSIPVFSYIVPVYFMFSKVNLTNTHPGIILIFSIINLPFNILFLRAFFLGIPKELSESAKIDGCSELGAFWRIIIPLAKPAIMTVALTVFVATWNDFMWSNIFLNEWAKKTIGIRFFQFATEFSDNLARIFTGGVIAVGPLCIIFLIFQRQFIEGITRGAVKG